MVLIASYSSHMGKCFKLKLCRLDYSKNAMALFFVVDIIIPISYRKLSVKPVKPVNSVP